MKSDTVTLWDRMTYHNRFTDKLMRLSGMRNWRRDKRQMIPFAVSVKSSLYMGLLAGCYTALALGLIFAFGGLGMAYFLVLSGSIASFVLTCITQFVSNCWWNARAMKLNATGGTKSPRPHQNVELLGELPEILR